MLADLAPDRALRPSLTPLLLPHVDALGAQDQTLGAIAGCLPSGLAGLLVAPRGALKTPWTDQSLPKEQLKPENATPIAQFPCVCMQSR